MYHILHVSARCKINLFPEIVSMQECGGAWDVFALYIHHVDLCIRMCVV